MFFNTEGSAIRTIISGFNDPTGGIVIDTKHALVYITVWYFFTITTYGVWVPAGLFLPGIIIGCAVGSAYETSRIWLFDLTSADYNVVPILTSAGGMLSGYTRLTYSLVVIMLETTSSINIFIPMMLSIMTARIVGSIFTRGLYDRAIRMKQIPVLRNNAPNSQSRLKAEKFMVKEVLSLPSIAEMSDIRKALTSTHSGFPVLNTAGNLVGLIPKHVLIILLEKKAFYTQ